eukprot:CAMPEP_0170543434 /NCGR_PEP_ID=MMETSP0211-20121228/2548_1 /TAXON_ID=311385 /ORGANISM="Pseudokeronopsis sp., Strain OXSARD2" /LENGTH=211 /DNA_ID=CAMNT_0010846803 /DNA_START=309 /DNA_END=944 /DNA_ORIENTATION=-
MIWFYALYLCHTCFFLMKCLEAQFLEWKPLPMNPFNNRHYGFNNNLNNAAVADEDDYNFEFMSKSFLLKKILAHNFFPHLFIYWLVDQKNIFFTSFELLVFLVTYTFFSLILASKEVTADYIKRVIETQISFSSSMALKKNETFLRRVKKIYNYFKIQSVIQVTSLVLLFWAYYYSNFSLIALLLYPGVGNMIEIFMASYNFKFQLQQALS